MPDDQPPEIVRVVVAGQVPPPLSGQHVAVERILSELDADERLEVRHLPYTFAESMGGQGRPTVGKLLEVLRIWWRLLRLRRTGAIDLYLHPVGGTSRSSTIRDLLILPAALTLSRHVVLQFHGAGHGRGWALGRSPLVQVARRVLGRCHAAVVHAEANAIDPRALGIRQVHVVPHRLVDRYRAELVARGDAAEETRLLYVGHLGPHRGTPELVAAVGKLAREVPGVVLTLAGEPIRDYSASQLAADIDAAGGPEVIAHVGPVSGEDKDRLFATSHALMFPSVFEAESFGLVLVEALMWGLPVVATDWRANPEVLGSEADGLVHPSGPDLHRHVGNAVHEAVQALRAGRLPTWSPANRTRYLDRFRADDGPRSPLADALVEIWRGHRSTGAPN